MAENENEQRPAEGALGENPNQEEPSFENSASKNEKSEIEGLILDFVAELEWDGIDKNDLTLRQKEQIRISLKDVLKPFFLKAKRDGNRDLELFILEVRDDFYRDWNINEQLSKIEGQVKKENRTDDEIREDAWKRILSSDMSYQTEFNKEDYHLIRSISERQGNWEEWEYKFNVYEAWAKGAGAGGTDLQELAFGNVKGAREAISKEKLSFSGIREYIWDSKEGERFREAFSVLDKIFCGKVFCTYTDENGERNQFKFDYISNGDPNDKDKTKKGEKVLTIKDLLSALLGKKSSIHISKIENTKGEEIDLDNKQVLSPSDIDEIYFLMFIYEYRAAKHSPIYAQYISSPKPSFDMKSIELSAPLSYVLYKAIGSSLIRPNFYELWFTQRLPNSGEGKIFGSAGEVIKDQYNGVPTRWPFVLEEALEVREKATDVFTTLDLFELSELMADYKPERIFNFYREIGNEDSYKNALESFQSPFTTRVNERYQTLPFMWDIFSAEKGNSLRSLTYKQIDEGLVSFSEFIEKIHKFPKGQAIKQEDIEVYLGDIIPSTSSLKGLEAALKGTEFYGIFIGTITIMLALYLKAMFDAYDSSTIMPFALKQRIFRNSCLDYLKKRSATFMDVVRGRLICFLEDSVGSLGLVLNGNNIMKKRAYDFFSSVKEIQKLEFDGVNIPVPGKLVGILDKKYRTFYRVPTADDLKDTNGS